MSDTACGMMPGFASLPDRTNVLPDAVWPYAKMTASKPSMAALRDREDV